MEEELTQENESADDDEGLYISDLEFLREMSRFAGHRKSDTCRRALSDEEVLALLDIAWRYRCTLVRAADRSATDGEHQDGRLDYIDRQIANALAGGRRMRKPRECREETQEVCKLKAQIRRAIDVTARVLPKMEQVLVPCREVGQTTREYFAAHAPLEPRWKFDVKMDTPCPDGGDYADGALLKWYEEKERREFSQWPWVWADAVLRAKTEET